MSAAGGGDSDAAQKARQHQYNLIVTSLDGNIKIPTWSLDAFTMKQGSGNKVVSSSNNDIIQMLHGDPSCAITAIQLSADRNKLYVGTSIGTLRVYPWPPEFLPTASTTAEVADTTATATTDNVVVKKQKTTATTTSTATIPATTGAATTATTATSSVPSVKTSNNQVAGKKRKDSNDTTPTVTATTSASTAAEPSTKKAKIDIPVKSTTPTPVKTDKNPINKTGKFEKKSPSTSNSKPNTPNNNNKAVVSGTPKSTPAKPPVKVNADGTPQQRPWGGHKRLRAMKGKKGGGK